jgi:hypothetical protein
MNMAGAEAMSCVSRDNLHVQCVVPPESAQMLVVR